MKEPEYAEIWVRARFPEGTTRDEAEALFMDDEELQRVILPDGGVQWGFLSWCAPEDVQDVMDVFRAPLVDVQALMPDGSVIK